MRERRGEREREREPDLSFGNSLGKVKRRPYSRDRSSLCLSNVYALTPSHASLTLLHALKF